MFICLAFIDFIYADSAIASTVKLMLILSISSFCSSSALGCYYWSSTGSTLDITPATSGISKKGDRYRCGILGDFTVARSKRDGTSSAPLVAMVAPAIAMVRRETTAAAPHSLRHLIDTFRILRLVPTFAILPQNELQRSMRGFEPKPPRVPQI